MPIKGLTDQLPSFPQIGCIRKGAPKGKNRPGQDLTYFRVTFDEQEQETAERFRAIYGQEPREINIHLPFDDIDRVWAAWREAYRAGALIHRCDGEFVEYAINTRTGEVLVRGGIHLETGERVPCSGKVDCRPHGRLRVIIPDLRRLAYLMVLTGSLHDIVNISAQLEALRDLSGGRLRGLPLVLRRRPKRISTPSGPNGKRARREKWLLSIEADPRWVEAKLEQLEGASFPQLPRLEAGFVEEPEEPIKTEVTTIAPEPPPPASEEFISDEPPPEATEEDFVAGIMESIPYFNHRNHVRHTLNKLGLAWSPDQENELSDTLEEYASRRADEKAAAQAAVRLSSPKSAAPVQEPPFPPAVRPPPSEPPFQPAARPPAQEELVQQEELFGF